MDNIVLPESNFDFSLLTLEPPMPLHGGSFFTKLNYQSKGMPLYIQLPKCVSKNGIVKNASTKKPYVDLQLDSVLPEVSVLENQLYQNVPSLGAATGHPGSPAKQLA